MTETAASARCLPGLPPGVAWVPVGSGESGDRVYRRTEWLATFGLGSARLLDWITSGDRGCLITAAVPGVPAGDLPLPALRAAWPSIARKVEALHDLPAGGCPFERRLPNLMVDPETLRCTGLIDLGRLGTADRHVDLALLLANARERWAGPEDERAARERVFDTHGIRVPDEGRLAFYLALDPLTWG